MKKMGVVVFLSFLLVVGFASLSFADIISGVNFPDGAISFADSVYSYTQGEGVSYVHNDPNEALGVPDYTSDTNYVSLGVGGSLILQFTDNSLTTSGDSNFDLWIFEVGAAVEWMDVAISTDAYNWISLGQVKGQPTGIDIDSITGVTSGARYSFVQISDVLGSSLSGYPYAEADIDAVGAISSAPPVPINPVPEPSTILLLGSGLVGLAWFGRQRQKG